jgi:hypothetical protein
MAEEAVITVSGAVLVDDILGALNLEDVPSGCSLDRDSRISFDDVEVKENDALAELGGDDEPEDLSYEFEQADVQGLAQAIRTGSRNDAEYHLDRMFGSNPTLNEWVQRGRYSKLARAA